MRELELSGDWVIFSARCEFEKGQQSACSEPATNKSSYKITPLFMKIQELSVTYSRNISEVKFNNRSLREKNL